MAQRRKATTYGVSLTKAVLIFFRWPTEIYPWDGEWRVSPCWVVRYISPRDQSDTDSFCHMPSVDWLFVYYGRWRGSRDDRMGWGVGIHEQWTTSALLGYEGKRLECGICTDFGTMEGRSFTKHPRLLHER